MEMIINDINNKISQEMKKESNTNQSSLDLTGYLVYRKDSNTLSTLIVEGTKLATDYWNEYSLDIPTFETLYQIGKKFNSNDDKISHYWQRYINRFREFIFEEYVLYAGYKSLVASSQNEGNKLLRFYESKISHSFTRKSVNLITNSTINDPKNIMITVRMDQNKLGTIKKVNAITAKVFGHDTKSLKGNKINILMPEYVREKHDSYLSNHLQTGDNSFLYSDRFLFAYHKEGFVVPIHVLVCPDPNLDQGFSYITIIRQFKTADDFLILSQDGRILQWTENIQRDMQLTNEEHSGAKLSQFCDVFDDLIKYIITYEWVISNLSVLEMSNTLVIQKKIELELICNPGKSDGLLVPESKDIFENIKTVYGKFYNEGIRLNFNSLVGSKPYICKLEATNSRIHDFRFLKLYRSSVNNKYLSKEDERITQFLTTKPNNSRKFVLSKNNYLPTEQSENLYTEFTNNQDIAPFIRPKVIRDDTVLHGSEEGSNNNAFNLNHAEMDKSQVIEFEDDDDEENGDHNSCPYIEENLGEEKIDTQMFMKGIINNVEDTVSQSTRREGSSEASVKSKRYAQQIGQNIKNRKPDLLNRSFGFLVSVFFIGIIVGIFNFYFYSGSILQVMNTTIIGIKSASNRLQTFIKLSQAVRKIDNLHHELLDTKYVGNYTDFRQNEIHLIQGYIKDIENSTPLVRNTYAVMDPDDILLLTSPITIIPPEDPDHQISLSIDEAYSLILSLALKICEADGLDVNLYLDQVLAFEFDDVLVRSEEIVDTFFDHLNQRLDLIQGYLIVLVAVQAAATVGLIVMFGVISYKSIHYRRSFLEALIKLDETKYLPRVKNLQNFSATLEGTVVDFDKGKYRKQMKMAKKKKKETKNKQQRRRKFYLGNFDRQAYFRVFLTILAVVHIFRNKHIFHDPSRFLH
jgi:PAS domain S-box-containing protein